MRYTVRNLFRNKALSIGAIATLSLAIGANTAMFTVVKTVLLQRLPFRDPDRLVWIWSTRTDRDKAFFSIPNFLEHQQRNRTLAGLAALTPWAPNFTGAGQAERFSGMRVTPNAFEMLGARAAAGRLLTPDDDSPSAEPVVVLSYGIWTQRFGASPAAIGQKLALNDDTYRIVGVLDARFLIPAADADVVTILSPSRDPRRGQRGSNFLRAFARLKPGVMRQQAQSDLAAINRDLAVRYPVDNAKQTDPRVIPLTAEITGNYRSLLWILLGAVAVVLLIACANLANLLLARGSARQRDLALRTALGASRMRIARELLAEALTLSLAGGALGLVLAAVFTGTVASFLPADVPHRTGLHMDTGILTFTAGVSLVAGLLFGSLPALQFSRADPIEGLTSIGRGGTSGHAAKHARGIFVSLEIAMAFVLLTGLGLVLGSFRQVQSVDPGCDPTRVSHFRVSLPASRYRQPELVKNFYRSLQSRLSLLPGVERVCASNALPLSGLNYRDDFEISGQPASDPSQMPGAQSRLVTPGYFAAMRIPILAGREFQESDDERSRLVAIVDESLSHRFFGSRNPIGAQIVIPPRKFEIVGVVRPTKYFGVEDDFVPTLYAPMYQVAPSYLSFLANGISFAVRGSRLPAETLRQTLQSVDSSVPSTPARTMEEALAIWLAPRRFNLEVLGAFACASLLLACAGIYAVVSFSVAEQAREIAIRSALGAPRLTLFQHVIAATWKQAACGIVAGIAAAAALAPLTGKLLFRVRPLDPIVLVFAALALIATALAASYLPSRRAISIEPIQALRKE
jgi:putative ABC transport system permease protein